MSDRTMPRTKPPTGIYIAATAFFPAIGLCVANVLNFLLFSVFGIVEVRNLQTINYVLAGLVIGLCVMCYATYWFVRLHPLARWLMFLMTIVQTIEMLIAPAGNSPFYSPSRIYVNRLLLLLPLFASCIYLLLPRVRAAFWNRAG